ncbi:hypothetical protein UFOVP652_23 [uncultured Caudovirales phage]|uniref:Uncharacterized protein n=1 Tax=uncultured Caudovirales phage TaxID=2100421 RepID=A0A6J5NCF6_9CAUD|nr:hypothetical protein UFOVP652_23 [uncultured Caudovirales phage]CAB5223943.1 hypothetical protein UFOVP734_16 [uncultured Caudovirales phage]
MTKRAITREQKMFKKLASTGRYVSTGKVLIGVAHVPRARDMTSNDVFIQNILLGQRRWQVTMPWMCYVALLTVSGGLLFALGMPK